MGDEIKTKSSDARDQRATRNLAMIAASPLVAPVAAPVGIAAGVASIGIGGYAMGKAVLEKHRIDAAESQRFQPVSPEDIATKL